MSHDLPSYDDLPVRPGAPPGSSWGLWGDDDRLGCLNLLTPERVLAAVATVRRGAVFALNLELDLPDPPLFGRAPFTHQVLGTGGHDDIVTFNTQSSSQWDGFRHIRSHHGYYNGLADGDHGVDHWAARGVAGRAVLADVSRWREQQSRRLRPDEPDPISVDDLEATLAWHGVDPAPGDVLLVRTGWLSWYRTLDGPSRRAVAEDLRAPGLAPGEATARYLWDHHYAAVAADNPAVEVWPMAPGLTADERKALRADPARAAEAFVHLRLLPLLGLPLGELWDLDALAADCAADGVYSGLFTSAPLRVPFGVASPPNAIVIK